VFIIRFKYHCNVNNIGTSSPPINQSMFNGAYGINAQYTDFSNVAGNQSNTYGISPCDAINERTRRGGPNAAESASPPKNIAAQSMFMNAQGVDARHGVFSNVAGSQSNIYADGSKSRSANGGQPARSSNGTYSNPSSERATPNAHTTPNVSGQNMFMNAQGVDARYGHFSNVGGSQSNTYYSVDDPDVDSSEDIPSNESQSAGTEDDTHSVPGQSMFKQVQEMRAGSGSFSNVGGSQSNTYHV